MELVSEGLRLRAHLARPQASAAAGARSRCGLVIAHGFPERASGDGATAWATFPDLADRLAAEAGWVCLTAALRGVGDSEGDFSIGGWLADLRAAVARLTREPDVAGVWLCGFDVGGALALCVAGGDPAVRGVAAFAAPADLDDWSAEPRRLLELVRSLGMVRDPAFPGDLDGWAREAREARPLRAVGHIPPRPLLLVHGGEDERVPLVDARALADAAEGAADLHVVAAADHHLRHDPRAIAVLLGWLDEQVALIPPPA